MSGDFHQYLGLSSTLKQIYIPFQENKADDLPFTKKNATIHQNIRVIVKSAFDKAIISMMVKWFSHH